MCASITSHSLHNRPFSSVLLVYYLMYNVVRTMFITALRTRTAKGGLGERLGLAPVGTPP